MKQKCVSRKISSLFVFFVLAAATPSARADDKWDISKVDASKLPPSADKQGVTYANDIQPLFKASCVRCHGEDRPKGDLRLDSLGAVLKGGKDGKVVVPGDSAKSLLVAAAAQIDPEIAMPPKRGPGGRGGPSGAGERPPGGPGGDGPPPGGAGGPGGFGGRGGFGPPAKALTSEQVALVRAWIDQGAK